MALRPAPGSPWVHRPTWEAGGSEDGTLRARLDRSRGISLPEATQLPGQPGPPSSHTPLPHLPCTCHCPEKGSGHEVGTSPATSDPDGLPRSPHALPGQQWGRGRAPPLGFRGPSGLPSLCWNPDSGGWPQAPPLAVFDSPSRRTREAGQASRPGAWLGSADSHLPYRPGQQP